MRAPELASIEAFAEYLLDDDRLTFTLADCQALDDEIKPRLGNGKIRAALEAIGFQYIKPEHGRSVRGFTTSSNDRWYGPGSSKTHGGGGCSSIEGFAGTPSARTSGEEQYITRIAERKE